jgi:hypothetical protein
VGSGCSLALAGCRIDDARGAGLWLDGATTVKLQDLAVAGVDATGTGSLVAFPGDGLAARKVGSLVVQRTWLAETGRASLVVDGGTCALERMRLGPAPIGVAQQGNSQLSAAALLFDQVGEANHTAPSLALLPPPGPPWSVGVASEP